MSFGRNLLSSCKNSPQ